LFLRRSHRKGTWNARGSPKLKKQGMLGNVGGKMKKTGVTKGAGSQKEGKLSRGLLKGRAQKK